MSPVLKKKRMENRYLKIIICCVGEIMFYVELSVVSQLHNSHLYGLSFVNVLKVGNVISIYCR
jgi:hypothetical protein